MPQSYFATTQQMRVLQAIQFIRKQWAWVGIGRTTAWTNEADVPAVISTTAFEELQAMKRSELLRLVVPDEDGAIEHLGQKWAVVSFNATLEDQSAEVARAVAAGARHVFVEAWLNYDEVPVVTFRQAGVFSEVVLASGVPAGTFTLLPAQIAYQGVCVAINNRTAVPRASDQRERLAFIIEF